MKSYTNVAVHTVSGYFRSVLYYKWCIKVQEVCAGSHLDERMANVTMWVIEFKVFFLLSGIFLTGSGTCNHCFVQLQCL